MKRIYHPYWTWEDAGMWRRVSGAERAAMLEHSVMFTGNAEAYGAAMLQVLDQFPIAVEHNLTDQGQNRKAWIGHAACYLAYEAAEDVVREAWGMLTEQQRTEANQKADEAIAIWTKQYDEKQNSQLRLNLEETGLSRGHSGLCAAAS